MPTIEQHFERTDATVRAVYETILKTARHLDVRLEKARDVNATVAAWLEKSYALAE